MPGEPFEPDAEEHSAPEENKEPVQLEPSATEEPTEPVPTEPSVNEKISTPIPVDPSPEKPSKPEPGEAPVTEELAEPETKQPSFPQCLYILKEKDFDDQEEIQYSGASASVSSSKIQFHFEHPVNVHVVNITLKQGSEIGFVLRTSKHCAEDMTIPLQNGENHFYPKFDARMNDIETLEIQKEQENSIDYNKLVEVQVSTCFSGTLNCIGLLYIDCKKCRNIIIRYTSNFQVFAHSVCAQTYFILL